MFPSPPLYIDDNTAVDVTGDGSYIIWDEGFSFYSDFTISLWGRNFTKDSNITLYLDKRVKYIVRDSII